MAAMPPLNNNSAAKSASHRPSFQNSNYRNRRIEHLHKKSIDESITAATSSGSSVSQPNSRRHRVISPTSSRNGGIPIEESVIFQKSAGLSKLLAPSSPGGSPKNAQTTKPLSAPSSPTTATRYANAIRRQRLAQRSVSTGTDAVPSTPATPPPSQPSRSSRLHLRPRPSSSANIKPSSSLSPPRETTTPMKMTHTTTVAAAMISAAASRRLEQNAAANRETTRRSEAVYHSQEDEEAFSMHHRMHARATSPHRSVTQRPSSPPSSASRRFANGPPMHSESPVARVRQQQSPPVPYSYSEISSAASYPQNSPIPDVGLVASLSSRDRYESILPPPPPREYRSQQDHVRGDAPPQKSPHRRAATHADSLPRQQPYSPKSSHARRPQHTHGKLPDSGLEQLPSLLPAIADAQRRSGPAAHSPHRTHHPSSDYSKLSSRQQPYPNYPPSRRRRVDEEGKKLSEHHVRGPRGGLQRSSSSSDYETDTSRGDHVMPHPSRFAERTLKNAPSNTSQMTPDAEGFLEASNLLLRDDDTYDYGDRDDDSQGSLSYEQRRLKMEREQEARAAAVAAAKAELDGPFMQKDDVEHYRKVVDTPLGRTAAGVAVAATVGCVVFGPVGLILGVAAVGIGVGYMQIPEEQRQIMSQKVQETMKGAQESALEASEAISNTCLASYKDSGMAEHVPVEMETCCASLAGMEGNGKGGDFLDEDSLLQHGDDEGEPGVAKSENVERRKGATPTHHSSWLREKKEKVSVLRKGKIIPLAQIHALDPSLQPRAWLDVLASADTSAEEKIEASEEILILAKDKQKSRVFVDEGILDCLLWTIGRYLEKERRGPGSEHWAHPNISPDEATAAKLAAQCCVTLGKSYCAAIHTEGDLLLMSLYDRGTVPEERQLAQMLLEVPHHTRSTITNDPTIVTPGKESFAVKQMTLLQAEELAAIITSLATGRNV